EELEGFLSGAFGAWVRTRLAYAAHMNMHTIRRVRQRRRPISSVKNSHCLFGPILSDPQQDLPLHVVDHRPGLCAGLLRQCRSHAPAAAAGASIRTAPPASRSSPRFSSSARTGARYPANSTPAPAWLPHSTAPSSRAPTVLPRESPPPALHTVGIGPGAG